MKKAIVVLSLLALLFAGQGISWAGRRDHGRHRPPRHRSRYYHHGWRNPWFAWRPRWRPRGYYPRYQCWQPFPCYPVICERRPVYYSPCW